MLLKFKSSPSPQKIAESAADLAMYFAACTQYVPNEKISGEQDYWRIRSSLAERFANISGEVVDVKMPFGKQGYGIKVEHPLLNKILEAPKIEHVPLVEFAFRATPDNNKIARMHALGMIMGTKSSVVETPRTDAKTRLNTLSNLFYKNIGDVIYGKLPYGLYHYASLTGTLCDMPSDIPVHQDDTEW